jgi:hypothetical protein
MKLLAHMLRCLSASQRGALRGTGGGGIVHYLEYQCIKSDKINLISKSRPNLNYSFERDCVKLF